MNAVTDRTPISDDWLSDVLKVLRGREEALRVQGYWGEADHLKRLIEAATDAAPQAATGTVPPESSAPAVAAPQPSAKLDTSPQVSHTT